MRFRTAMSSIFVSACNAAVFILFNPTAVMAQNEIDMPGSQNLVQAAQQTLASDHANPSGALAGLGNFSVANLIGGMIFSSIGLVAFIYGKKQASFKPMMLGILLMGYSWVVSSTLMVYIVGIALTAALYFFRD